MWYNGWIFYNVLQTNTILLFVNNPRKYSLKIRNDDNLYQKKVGALCIYIYIYKASTLYIYIYIHIYIYIYIYI